MLNIVPCFPTLKSDSQSKWIADSSPEPQQDPEKTTFIKSPCLDLENFYNYCLKFIHLSFAEPGPN